MLKKFLMTTMLAAAALAAATHAQSVPDPAIEAVKQKLHERLGELDVGTVRRTPYGFFEVQAGSDLLYTDENATWVMQGRLIDVATRRDVTRASLEELGNVPFSQLPLDLAFKQVKGDGSRKVAVFEDPNCGYCKQLRHNLQGVNNVTVYTFLLPILAPDSPEKSRNVWCAKNPGKAWDDWMINGKLPPEAKCDAPLDKLVALGQKLMIRGTPTLFFEHAGRVSGTLSKDELEEKLAVR